MRHALTKGGIMQSHRLSNYGTAALPIDMKKIRDSKRFRVYWPMSAWLDLAGCHGSILFTNTFSLLSTSIAIILCQFNPLPDNRILDWSKLKQITGDALKCI